MKTNTPARSDLEARRRSLALEAAEGDTAAAASLVEVEAELAALNIAEERAALAEQERAQRDREREEHRRAVLRQTDERDLRALARKRLKVVAAVEETVATLEQQLAEGIELGQNMNAIEKRLGRSGAYEMKESLLGFLLHRFGPFFPYDLPRAGDHRARPLSDIEREVLEPLLQKTGANK